MISILSLGALSLVIGASCPSNYVDQWGGLGSEPGHLTYPYSVTVDTHGDVWVADTHNNRVQHFDGSGTFLTMWGSSGTGDGEFDRPSDIAFDPGADTVYVVDLYNHRVQRFTRAGVFVSAWGGVGSQPGKFWQPRGIAVDQSGYVYVGDWGNDRVQKFTPSGAYVLEWGGEGSGNGQLRDPSGIAIDALGNIYVAEWGNNRIQVFSNTGIFLRKWGTLGSAEGQLYAPLDVSIDTVAGLAYVADANNDRIQQFLLDGTYQCSWGSAGSTLGLFDWPTGVAVGSQGNVLYVSDGNNHRIQEFSYPPSAISRDPASAPHLMISPNPGSGVRTVWFTIPTSQNAVVKIYDVKGRLVRRLLDGWQSVGAHRVIWDERNDRGSSVASGVYFVRLMWNSTQISKKVIVYR